MNFTVQYRKPNTLTGTQNAFKALSEALSSGAGRMELRKGIQNLEYELMKLPQTEQPITHQFTDGLYLRTIINPKGCVIVTKIHREPNVSTILKGKLLCITEDGLETLTAPAQFITKPGTKRVLFSEEETVFSTTHPNPENITDLDELEARIIAPDFESVEMEVMS